MVKVIRDKRHFKTYMNSTLDYLGPTLERLAFAILGMLLFCHISCCVWYMLVSLNDSEISWPELYQLEDLSDFDVNLTSELNYNNLLAIYSMLLFDCTDCCHGWLW